MITLLYNYLCPELVNLTSLPTRLTSRGTAGERLGHYLLVFREESDNLLRRQTLSSLFMFPRNIGDVLELPRGRLYPLFSGNNDISLCKGSKCRDDC